MNPEPNRSVKKRKKSSQKRATKKAAFKKIELLYLWRPILESAETTKGDDVFRDAEKLLYKWGLHSRLTEREGRYTLYVRESEYEYAHALLHEEVSALYGKTTPDYILFKDDFDYKNEKFYGNDGAGRRVRINVRMSMVIITITIILSMIVFYYMTR